tara:strand:+ start:103 stop:684 length:582 start_codon:yes stop_codon:yes gene_type:complete
MTDNLPEFCDFYCEENTWRALECLPQACYALIICNKNQEILCCNQLVSGRFHRLLTWDYHVIPILYSDGMTGNGDLLVIDRNAMEGPICPLSRWFECCFPYVSNGKVIAEYAAELEPFLPRFRLIEKTTYLQLFSSDRSHMKRNERWLRSPPSWAPIYSGKNTLSTMTDPDDQSWPHQSFSLQTFWQWLSETP